MGDFIAAGDVMGTVKEIGFLVTSIDTIDTMDNIRTFVGNSKVSQAISRISPQILIGESI